MAIRSADAIGTGIAAADDDHVLVGRHQLALELVARVDLVLLRQEIHREMHALELAPRHRQIARLLGAAGHDHRIEVFLQLFRRNGFLGPVVHIRRKILADQHTGAESHAFGFHLRDAAVDMRFFHLEIGNAVTQQAADAIGFFEHGHIVPGARQLLRGCHAGRPGTDDRDFLASLRQCWLWRDPAVFPALVDDEMLDRLDADRIAVDAERAGRFARCGADAAGEFGEVVGRVQRIERLAIAAAVHQIVPVRNDVVDRTAVVTERNAAVHATRALNLGVAVGQVHHEFLVMLGARLRRFAALFQQRVFHKACYFTHYSLTFLATRCIAAAFFISRRPR